MDTNNIALLLASKLATKKADRDTVQPGEYKIDALVHIHGTMRVGKDFFQDVPQELCPWTLFQIALSKMNTATVDSILDDAILAVQTGKKIDTTEIKKVVTRKCAAALKDTNKEFSGKVTIGTGNAEIKEIVKFSSEDLKE